MAITIGAKPGLGSRGLGAQFFALAFDDQPSTAWRAEGGSATAMARIIEAGWGRGAEPMPTMQRLPVLFDLGFGDRFEVGDDVGPGRPCSRVRRSYRPKPSSTRGRGSWRGRDGVADECFVTPGELAAAQP